MKDRLQIIIFIVLISLPFFITFILPSKFLQNSNIENRKLSSFPKAPWKNNSWTTFPRKFESYFNDHFAFKNDLVQGYGILKTVLFRSSMNGNIFIGKDGWIFIDAPHDLMRNQGGYSKKQLSGIKTQLVKQRDAYEKKGIDYWVIPVPSTEDIYPEYLPDEFKSDTPNTRYDSINNYMKKDPQDDMMIDLKQNLLENKWFTVPKDWPTLNASNPTTMPIYNKMDLHWNQIGAYIAYTKIINVLKVRHPCLSPIPLSQMNVSLGKSMIGTANQLGVAEYYKNTDYFLSPKLPAQGGPDVQCPDLRLTIVDDSMINTFMMPWLFRNFGEITTIYKKVPYAERMKEIKHSKPNILIDERTERGMETIWNDALSSNNGIED